MLQELHKGPSSADRDSRRPNETFNKGKNIELENVSNRLKHVEIS